MKMFFSVLRVILLVFFLGLFCYSGWQLWEIYQVYQTGNDLYADVAAQVVHMETDTREDDEAEGESEPAAPGASAPETEDIGITVDFDALLEINPDTIAWIRFDIVPIPSLTIRSCRERTTTTICTD